MWQPKSGGEGKLFLEFASIYYVLVASFTWIYSPKSRCVPTWQTATEWIWAFIQLSTLIFNYRQGRENFAQLEVECMKYCRIGDESLLHKLLPNVCIALNALLVRSTVKGPFYAATNATWWLEQRTDRWFSRTWFRKLCVNSSKYSAVFWSSTTPSKVSASHLSALWIPHREQL